MGNVQPVGGLGSEETYTAIKQSIALIFFLYYDRQRFGQAASTWLR